jgi:hypothetical protein
MAKSHPEMRLSAMVLVRSKVERTRSEPAQTSIVDYDDDCKSQDKEITQDERNWL